MQGDDWVLSGQNSVDVGQSWDPYEAGQAACK